jgi:predicted permease
MTDLKYAWRAITRMPVLATVVILSIGVGIGVNTAVFSWIQAMVFQPLPGVRDGADFHFVEPRGEGDTHPGSSWLEYRDLRDRLGSFRDLLAFRMVPFNVGERDRTERTYGLLVSGNYFSALGVQPRLGRFLRPEEVNEPGGAPVAVISEELWQTRYASAPDVLQRTIRVNDRELAIVGVTPARFQGTVLGLRFDVWAPATLAPVLYAGSRELEDRGQRGYSVMGRLAPHATQGSAQADVDAAMRELALTHPESNAGMRAEVLRFWDAPRGPQRLFIRALVILQSVLLLLLLAVCGNTANLVLARASARQREIGVRLALGASRWRVVRLLLTENLLLAVCGATLGAAIAVWGTQALRAVPMIGAFPIRFQTSVDFGGLAFAMLLGAACGLAFGIGPAAHLARLDTQRALRASAGTPARRGIRGALMGVEVALALMVLVAATMFLRSFRQSQDTDPGFRREGMLLAAYDLTGGGRRTDTAFTRSFASRLLEHLRAIPGVESAAIATSVPLDIHGLPVRSFVLEGRARSDGQLDQALRNVVTPDYFRTMRIGFRSGSDFAHLDDATAPAQVIVNAAFVDRFLPGVEALGRRLEAGDRTYTIIGVVRNSTYESFGETAKPIIYYSYRDRPSSAGEIHLRTRDGGEMLVAPRVRQAVRALDASLPVFDVRSMSDHIERNLFLRRIPARLFVVLGPLLLALAAVGIYAVVAYAVAHRTREIGVRIALGASAGRVVRQILDESMRAIIAGALVGWVLAFAVDRHLIRGEIDLAAFVGVPALLLAVAAIACALPARRATKVDPVIALRHE